MRRNVLFVTPTNVTERTVLVEVVTGMLLQEG